MLRPTASHSLLAALGALGILSLSGTLLAQQGSSALESGAAPAKSEAKEISEATPTAEAAGGSSSQASFADASTGGTSSETKEKEGEAEELRLDPKGLVGISPFWEEVVLADASYLAGDLSGAQGHYSTAIAGDEKNPIGQLRLAELSMKQGKLPEAKDFAAKALELSAENVRTKAKASFIAAEIIERQRVGDEAVVAWRAYKTLASQALALAAEEAKAPATEPGTSGSQAPLPVQIFSKSADQKIAIMEAFKTMATDYAPVKKRIEEQIEKAKNTALGR